MKMGWGGAKNGYTELGKVSLVGVKEVFFFSYYLRRRSMKDMVRSNGWYRLGNRFTFMKNI